MRTEIKFAPAHGFNSLQKLIPSIGLFDETMRAGVGSHYSGRLRGEAIHGPAQLLNIERLVQDHLHVHLLVGFTDFWRKMCR